MENWGSKGSPAAVTVNCPAASSERVLLARALCATRKLLLLDELVSGLDPKVASEMYALDSQTEPARRHYHTDDFP